MIDGERFMTLATADADGRPWACPVWFATEDHRDFYWVSHTDVRHSQDIAARPEVALMFFDSRQTPGDGRSVYCEATARRSDAGIEVFSAESVKQGMGEWTKGRVTGDAPLRLYRATVTSAYVLREDVDKRVPVELT